MKKLGLVGGMGPESTLIYYREILKRAKERSIDNQFPRVIVDSVNLYEILDYAANDKDRLALVLLESLENLQSAGAEILALTSNTSHLVYDRLLDHVDRPMISILDATCNEVKRLGYHKVGLLGTKVTMQGRFFRAPFVREGINLVTPDPATRNYIHNVIMTELENGIVKEDTRKEFDRIILQMKEMHGIEAVILGCTELPMLYDGIEAPVKLLDTMELHIEALVEEILEG